MKSYLIVILLFIMAGCAVKPEPLQFGNDMCYSCKMTLMDYRYGAEIVTKKGKVFKFDDINCMLTYYHSENEEIENFAYVQIIDYNNPGNLIDAQHALYIKSNAIHTPMASGIAAFINEESYKKYNRDWKGILMSWGEVVTQFK